MKTITLKCAQTYNEQGQLICEQFWLNGEMHNPNGSDGSLAGL